MVKICQLLGIYMFCLLGETYYKNNVGIYGDDSLIIFKNIKNMQVGFYMLFLLGETHDINNAGLYRDDDLSVFKNIDRPEACKKSNGHNKEY